MLGRALIERLTPAHRLVGLSRHPPVVAAASIRHLACDLSRRDAAGILAAETPDAIIHAAAMSDVDGCQREPEAARLGNVEATATVVEAARRSGAYLIAVSTDYVFDGTQGTAYRETDAPHPTSVYGQTKLAAEERVKTLPAGRWAIVRTSTLFGPGRPSFIDGIIARAARGEAVAAFRDQTTSPTYAIDLAGAMAALLDRVNASSPPSGILHAVNRGWCTRVAFAQHVLSVLGYPPTLVTPVALADQQLPAPRPTMAALATDRWSEVFGWELPTWQDAVKRYLAWHHTHSTR